MIGRNEDLAVWAGDFGRVAAGCGARVVATGKSTSAPAAP